VVLDVDGPVAGPVTGADQEVGCPPSPSRQVGREPGSDDHGGTGPDGIDGRPFPFFPALRGDDHRCGQGRQDGRLKLHALGQAPLHDG
jgi:hypothetical protein